MSNNIFPGGNPVVPFNAVDISTLGFTSGNTRKVVKPGVNGNPDKSFIPGGGLNTLTGVLPVGEGIDIYALTARDMTNNFYGGGYVSSGGETVDPTAFLDEFVGSAGAYNGTTHPSKGTATVGNNPTLDGSGNLVFPSGSGYLQIEQPYDANRKLTAVLNSIPDNNNVSIFLRFGTGVDSNIGLFREGSVYSFQIRNGLTSVTTADSLSVTFPATIVATINNGQITATLNGANPLTAPAQVGNEVATVSLSNGGSLAKVELLNV